MTGGKGKKFFRFAGAAAVILCLVWLGLRFSPYPELARFRARPCSVPYYDRNGVLVQIPPVADGDGLRREYRSLEEIPAALQAVFICAEDRRFYRHPGIDLVAIARAAFQNAAGGRRVSGASTITMQLARLVAAQQAANSGSPAGGRGSALGRKIGEALNALRLEARLSKNEILELYLNSLPFGFQTEGAASAARTFFAADLSMLSPAQIFCLAVIPRRPGLYNPLDNPSACIAAAAELQIRFRNNKKLAAAWPLLAAVTEADWQFASSSARRFNYPFELPHFVRYVGAKTMLVDAKKASGAIVQLSVDLTLQHYIEGLIAGNVERYYSSRLTNGAAIVINNATGEILAWVGSADYNNTEAAGQIDGVLALNQPGSSMKPFLYAMALENGFKPTDVLADIPMNFGETELYIPQNFNNRFNGPMLFRSALASSLNIPAVYLLYRLGVQNYTGRLFSLGFDSLEQSAETAGLGLALGNAPVSLAELARAFSVFPRDGVLIPLSWEKKGGYGEPKMGMEEEKSAREPGVRIFQSDTARIICSFLSDQGARALAFGSARNFQAPFPAIFKTGTANQYQSIVALGATPLYTVVVWMGNFTGETVIGKTGSSIPAAIVRDTLIFLQGRSGQGAGTQGGPGFSRPEAWALQRVCALSGMAPTAACFSVIGEYVPVAGADGLEPCTWHRAAGASGEASPGNGPSAVVYPAEYQSWFAGSLRQGEVDYSSRPLEIISPREGFVFLRSPGIGRDEIPVEVIGGAEDRLTVNYDGEIFAVNRPFVFYLTPRPGAHTLRVQNGDEEAEVMFAVEG
ncbi:penicillin-binding protein 1A [Spirochaetia bacterium]|nr:penicillin-binding protein 1A [Spirochaetia bacterium]